MLAARTDSRKKMSNLSGGIYTITQAARLLQVSPTRLRFWVSGPDLQAGPIVRSELEPIDHQVAISFINLVEVKFIHAFSKYGVKVRSIRCMAEEAKRILQHPHPFATDMIFRTDGQRIFIETAEKTGDKKLYDLRGKNWGIYSILMEGLKKDLIFGPSGMATGWYPRKSIAPNVVVHPKVAFGQPALEESGVPSQAIYDAYTADGEDVEGVARWFDIPKRQVVEAVNFQIRLQTVH